jgi:hypothetical protein
MHRPGDDPTLELPVPTPASPPPVDDRVPYPPHPPPAPTPPAWGAPRPRGQGCLVALAVVAGLTVLLVLLAAALLARASDSADDERRREAADVQLTPAPTSFDCRLSQVQRFSDQG